jgi:hypothetical protein
LSVYEAGLVVSAADDAAVVEQVRASPAIVVGSNSTSIDVADEGIPAGIVSESPFLKLDAPPREHLERSVSLGFAVRAVAHDETRCHEDILCQFLIDDESEEAYQDGKERELLEAVIAAQAALDEWRRSRLWRKAAAVEKRVELERNVSESQERATEMARRMEHEKAVQQETSREEQSSRVEGEYGVNKNTSAVSKSTSAEVEVAQPVIVSEIPVLESKPLAGADASAASTYDRLQGMGVPQELIDLKKLFQGVGSSVPQSRVSVRDHAVYGKYMEELRNGTRDRDELRRFLEKDNINTFFLDVDESTLVEESVSVRVEAPLFEHPVYKPYFKMVNDGASADDVAQLMRYDGVDDSLIFGSPLKKKEYYITVDADRVDKFASRRSQRMNAGVDKRKLHWQANKQAPTGNSMWEEELEGGDIAMDMDEFDHLFRRNSV